MSFAIKNSERQHSLTNSRLTKSRSFIVMKKFLVKFLAIPIALCLTASVQADFPTGVNRDAGSQAVTAASASTVSNVSQISGKPQADIDPSEAGSTHVPSFLFLIGLGLIGLRLVVSYRRKRSRV